MWLLPSRGRPRNIKRFISAWSITEASTPLWLRLDKDDPLLSSYLSLEFPSSWIVEVGSRRRLSNIYDEAYVTFYDPLWWGFIADDVVPETINWDTRLIAAAGSDGMAVPAGAHEAGQTPHFVLGADLVHSMGWLALPGLDRLYIDTVWANIARRLKVIRYVRDVVLTHRHFSNRLSRFDDTYKKERKDQDRELYINWCNSYYRLNV